MTYYRKYHKTYHIYEMKCYNNSTLIEYKQLFNKCLITIEIK